MAERTAAAHMSEKRMQALQAAAREAVADLDAMIGGD
jgi:hypothetical protein